MGVIESAVNWAIGIANDQGHGYSQADRWGPDYDCSSFVISAFEQAGVAVREAGASYTGNMYNAFLNCGFRDVTAEVELGSGRGIQAGDVLLNRASHTCLAVGNFKVANCRTDEGNPQSGDQSGNEIRVQNYWNYPWDCVLRYVGGEASVPDSSGTAPEPEKPRSTLRKGDRGEDVKALQERLIAVGYSCGKCKADGIFGSDTMIAVVEFQEDYGLNVTGVADPETINLLNGTTVQQATDGEDHKDAWLQELRLGSRGDAVKLLQAALTLRGYPCGGVDGVFGKNTEAALDGFKNDRHMDADGKVDLEVWAALLEVWKP